MNYSERHLSIDVYRKYSLANEIFLLCAKRFPYTLCVVCHVINRVNAIPFNSSLHHIDASDNSWKEGQIATFPFNAPKLKDKRADNDLHTMTYVYSRLGKTPGRCTGSGSRCWPQDDITLSLWLIRWMNADCRRAYRDILKRFISIPYHQSHDKYNEIS